MERALERLDRRVKVGDKTVHEEVALLISVHEALGRGEPLRRAGLSPIANPIIESLRLLTAKPLFYIANLDEEGLQHSSAWLDEVRMVADAEGTAVVLLCAKLEVELAAISPAEAAEFSAVMGLSEHAMPHVIRAGY